MDLAPDTTGGHPVVEGRRGEGGYFSLGADPGRIRNYRHLWTQGVQRPTPDLLPRWSRVRTLCHLLPGFGLYKTPILTPPTKRRRHKRLTGHCVYYQNITLLHYRHNRNSNPPFCSHKLYFSCSEKVSSEAPLTPTRL